MHVHPVCCADPASQPPSRSGAALSAQGRQQGEHLEMDLYGDLPKARDGDAKAKEWAKAPVLVPVATIRPLERDKKRKRPTPPATLAPRQALVRPTQGGDAVAKGGRGEGAAASSSGRGTSSRANAPASSRQPASINAVLDDAYDPLKPNDYMAELESRAAREEEAKRREHEQRCAGMREFLRFLKERERTYTDSREQIDGLRISGEEAYLRRARIGQAPSVPAGPDASAHQASQPAMSVAEKLMAKMGWRKGDGLGKAKQGIKTALEAEVVGAGRGRMVGANEKPSGEAAGDGVTVSEGRQSKAGSAPRGPDPHEGCRISRGALFAGQALFLLIDRSDRRMNAIAAQCSAVHPQTPSPGIAPGSCQRACSCF